MKKQAFQRGMAIFAATWPDRAPTADTTAAYWLALRGLHDSAFEAAVAECLRTCTFYPRPAEILAAADRLLTDAGVLPADGETAWAQVLEGAHRWHPDTGWRGPSGWTPQVKAAVDALGGVRRVKLAQLDDLGFVRREFLEAYGHQRARLLRYDMPELLAQPLPASRPALPQVHALEVA